MERNYELKPQRVTPERAGELSATAFRCGGWSVRGPDSWRTWTWGERAVAVGGVALIAGVGLVGLALPVLMVGAVLRWIGGAL